MKKLRLLKTLLVAVGLGMGASASAEDWSTVWTTDFSSAPSGMTYSISAGSCNITNGYLWFKNDAGSGNRTQTAKFTNTAFNVDTNWKMEFDWNCGQSNGNNSNVTFATNKGNAFTLSWQKNNGTNVTVTDASGTELTTTLPVAGYNISSISKWSHITIIGNTENGIYLTITNNGTTYVDNKLVTATYGYPASFDGTLGKSVAAMGIDNITFATPKIAGYVAPPTGTITAPVGTDRKFTLSCLTDGATIYYAESDIEIGAAGWTTYSSEVTTSAATIYTYASDGVYNSEKANFATGAGTAITLNAPTVTVNNMIANGSYYNVRLDAWYNTAGVEFTPAATLSATFTPDGGSASVVSLPYTVTEKGTLTVTSSAAGFTSAKTEVAVAALYGQTWQSLDFSSLVGTEAVQAALDTDWTQQDGHGRWASWADQSYNFYQHGMAGTGNITVNDKLKMREVVLLAEGRGLGRNVSGSEAISVSTSTGEIVGFEMYNGFGADINKGVNTFMSYGINLGGNPSVNTNNGALLVQATIFAAVPANVSVEVSAAGMATYVPTYDLDFSATTLKAYKAEVKSKGICTLTAVDEVPAGTPVLLIGATENVPVMNGAADVTDNDLVAGTGAAVATKDGGYTNMILNNVSGIGFYFAAGQTVAANRAYLHFDSSLEPAAARMSMVFDDEATGINSVQGEGLKENGSETVYNLNGQRVMAPQRSATAGDASTAGLKKGLFIMNGKKVIVK